jgi:hypothetical protein
MMEFPVCIEAEQLVQLRIAKIRWGRTLAKKGNVTMSLEMKSACEKCGRQLELEAEAYICSYECTFCRPCTDAMAAICPNCAGELRRRPRRKRDAGTNP